MAGQWTSETRERAGAFLRGQSTLALATVNGQGRPQVAPVFYVSDDALNLYWLSSSTSRHSVNLLERPDVAATVYPEIWEWQAIRGLQVEGRAAAVEDSGLRDQMLRLYRAKFHLPPQLDAVIAASMLYVLRPAWLRWLDNSVNFGYKTESLQDR